MVEGVFPSWPSLPLLVRADKEAHDVIGPLGAMSGECNHA